MIRTPLTFGQLRTCIRWQRRDHRYRMHLADVGPNEIAAVRAWRVEEAERVKAPAELMAMARGWLP